MDSDGRREARDPAVCDRAGAARLSAASKGHTARVEGKVALRLATAPVLVGAVVAFALDTRAREAADQAQGPFLLVTGLLLLGVVADADGVFRWASARLLGVTTHARGLLVVALLLVAVVTALLNLDTAVVFLTPILLGAARGADVDEEPFLYGVVLMANASSLLLPGANLTNLLVLSGEPVGGATFALRILPAALAAALVTAAGLVLLAGRRPRPAVAPRARNVPAGATGVRPLGALACVLAAVLVLALPHPGLPVLAVGLLAAAVRIRERRVDPGAAVEAVGPLALATLFALSVLLGLVARVWSGPTDLLASASPWTTCAIGALAAVGLNNLPAAVLLSATPPPHPRALLLGLNLGPNLAVTGSLSSYLWFKAARNAGAHPSARRFSMIGGPLGISAMLAGLATIALVGPS
ncbi:MAG: arsenical pump rane protein [Baekduia sp.]|nr:arsenical pump rane protein [Baekduia sp.]